MSRHQEALRQVKRWLPRLSMHAWTIKVKMGEPAEVRGAAAQIQYDSCWAEGTIVLAHKKDLEADGATSLTTEVTVVHELIHAKATECGVELSSTNPQHERFINEISKALVGRWLR